MSRSNSPNFLIFAVICCALVYLPVLMGKREAPVFSNDGTQKIQDFQFTDTKGETHRLSDFKGKTIMLHVWASWCPPCVSEFPVLLNAVGKRDDVVLIALSVDDAKSDMKRFLYSLKAIERDPIMYVYDGDEKISSSILNVSNYPETFILNENLTIIDHIHGARNWNSYSFPKN